MNSKSYRLLLFSSLYFPQGAVLAYFNSFQKPYLNSVGLSPELIGLLGSVLILPFVLKVFFGIIADRGLLFRWDTRKPYIVFGLLLSLISLVILYSTNPKNNFEIFLFLLFLSALGVALFDTATDGLAMDITSENEQGLVQSFMVGGRAFGLILLSFLFGFSIQEFSYHFIFLLLASSMIIPLFLVKYLDEGSVNRERKEFEWKAFKSLCTPQLMIFSVFAFVSMLVMWGGINGLITFFMDKNFNISSSQIGFFGTLSGIGMIAGAIFGGRSIRKIFNGKLCYFSVVGISSLSLLFSLTTTLKEFAILGVPWGFFFGLQQTIVVSLAMRLTDHRAAASIFTILMVIANIGLLVGEGLITSLVSNYSFSSIFSMLAGINLILIPLISILFKYDVFTIQVKKSELLVNSQRVRRQNI